MIDNISISTHVMIRSNPTHMHHLIILGILIAVCSCQVDQPPVEGLYSFSDSVDVEVTDRDIDGVAMRYVNYDHPDFADLFLIEQCRYSGANKVDCKINADSDNLDSYFEFLTDELLLWRFNKIYGEIDEVYLGYLNQENITQSKQAILRSYCDQYDQISFQIPVDYSGLVFVMQDQPENSISFLPEGIVIQSTRQLDLKSYICNKYVLATDYGTIYTAIRENMGIQTDLDALEVENWGFNSGPYHDILARTGYTGEVMVFKVLSVERP